MGLESCAILCCSFMVLGGYDMFFISIIFSGVFASQRPILISILYNFHPLCLLRKVILETAAFGDIDGRSPV